MATAERLFKCNGCNNKFDKNRLNFKHGQVLITFVGEKDVLNRDILLLVSIKAWRWLCNPCVISENKLNERHIKDSGGKILDLSEKGEWKTFCEKYHEIAVQFGFGVGICAMGQYSPFLKITQNNKWYKFGKYRSYNVLELFTPKSAIDEEKKEETDEEIELIYDTTGLHFSSEEFSKVIQYMIINKFAQIHSKTTWFKEQNMSLYMKRENYPYRDPAAYDRLLGRVKRQGEKHSLFKGNVQLWNDYQKMMKQVKKMSDKKYLMGKTKEISIEAAKTGLFDQDKRQKGGKKRGKKGKSGKEIISNNLEIHEKNFVNKKSLEEQKLICSQKQTEILGDIGKGLCMISMMGVEADDIWGDLIVFVTTEYEPESERRSVLNIIQANKARFIIIWKVVMKGGDKKFPKGKKTTLIKNSMNMLPRAHE
eukprot:28518_1